MDTITIEDLELFCRVGVTEKERGAAQRLLLTLEIERDLSAAAVTDDLRETVDYDAVARRLIALGNGRQWQLIEALAADVAKVVLGEFQADEVTVEVKKFCLPQTRYVSVRLTRASP